MIMKLKFFKHLLIIVFILTITQVHGFKKHPVHISLANIELNNKTDQFDVIIKVFTIDFEDIMKRKYQISLNLGNVNELKQANEYIINYLEKNLKISYHTNFTYEPKFKFTRKEIVDEFTWIYLSCNGSKYIKTLNITDTLFLELFPDQKNLLFVSYNNITFDYILSRENECVTINWR